MKNNEMIYDIIIVGGGVAGLTAAIYALRGGKNVLILEKYGLGGQVSSVARIDNYPGVIHAEGYNLATTMGEQAKEFGAIFKSDEIIDAELLGDIKVLKTANNFYRAKSVILAGGASANTLGVEGEKELVGKGVSYCASCDGGFFRGNVVCVVGGGNVAVYDALYLANICKKVYLIVRGEKLRADELNKQQLMQKVSEGKIEIIYSCQVKHVLGKDFVSGVELSNGTKLDLSGVFMAIGRKPDTEYLPSTMLNDKGYILTDENMKTTIDGVFAAGDIRNGVLKQAITACGDGAIAGTMAVRYLNSKK